MTSLITGRILLSFAAFLLLVPATFCADQKPKLQADAVRAFVEKSAETWRKNDLAGLDAALSPDFINILPNGRLQTREAIVQGVRDGVIKFSEYKIEDLKIRIYGEVAVATYVINCRFKLRDAESQNRFATTDVIVQSEKGMKIVSSHSSMVAPSSSSSSN